MKTRLSDVLILGSGPSGRRAGISAPFNRKVTFLDPDVYGKRILVSGNGRANFFNRHLLEEATYNAFPFSKVKDIVLDKENSAEKFFSFLTEDLSFPYREEKGLLYPYFNRSECLLSFLLDQLKQRNASFLEGRALSIKDHSLFSLNKDGEKEEIRFNDVILSLGGESYDRKEHANDSLLSSLKLNSTPYQSCLCPILVKERIPSCLKNQRLKGRVTLCYKDKPVFSEEGEVLFKKDGLSGICIFNLSLYLRHEIEIGKKRKDRTIALDYRMGGKSFPLSCYPRFLKQYSVEEKLQPGSALVFHPSAFYPLKESQVSYGGISLDEIYPETRELKKHRHYYRVGERLDQAFPCGGFNRGISFIEGYIAGKALENE